jgi:hypothetical protein
LAIASCGGGVDSGGTGGSTLAVGPIGGLGSIIVNGIRFDESAAAITNDDGEPLGRDRLKLGVFTVVEGTLTSTAGAQRLATAARVRVSSELIGDVEAVDTGAKTFTVLEQTVKVTVATVFDDGLPLGLDSVQTGQSLEIYGQFDPAGRQYVATRVELRPQPAYRLIRGTIDSVDTARGIARIGALTVDLSALPPAEATNVVAGALLRLRLQPGGSQGTWRAEAAAPGVRSLVDSDESSIEGRISSFESASTFAADGTPIDASQASFPNGTAGLGTGVRVSIEGTARNGVLFAKEVRIEGDEDASNAIFELHGAIDAIDTTRKVLSLRGVTVDFSGPVTFAGGSEADLALGRQIEVKGVLGPNGVGLDAQQITFESS